VKGGSEGVPDDDDDTMPVRPTSVLASSQGCGTSKHTTADACPRGLSGGVLDNDDECEPV
jgi:hypothetical protein